MGQTNTLGSSYHNLGINYEELNLMDSALLYLEKARKIREEHNDLRGLTKTYNSMGTVYNKLNMPDSAEYYARKAVSLDEEMGDQVALAWDQASLADILFIRGKYQESTSLAKTALSNT
ncbi:MAG: hypothetical protein Tsb0034_23160 [Ekhidna sp.]